MDIIFDENITVSPSSKKIFWCISFAIQDKAALGSPCEPVQIIITLLRLSLFLFKSKKLLLLIKPVSIAASTERFKDLPTIDIF